MTNPFFYLAFLLQTIYQTKSNEMADENFDWERQSPEYKEFNFQDFIGYLPLKYIREMDLFYNLLQLPFLNSMV